MKIESFKVEWIEEQIPKSRQKRDFIQNYPTEDYSYIDTEQLRFNDVMWPKLWYIVSEKKSFFNPSLISVEFFTYTCNKNFENYKMCYMKVFTKHP